ncbi:hypothetical protein ACFL6R_02510 [Gemmatimonadota bacterium]
MTTVNVSAQDAALLSQAILHLSRQQLASVIALLENTRLNRLLERRIVDLISKSDQSFERTLMEESEHLAQLDSAELSIRLMGRLNQELKIQPRNYASERDVLDNAEDILEAAILLKGSIDKEFSGNSLADLVRYQMLSLLRGIGSEIEGLDEDAQSEIVSSVREFVNQLPEEQQQQIKNALGADELTDKVVIQAIVSGSLATAFAATVHFAGFTFYTSATSLLASLTGALGLTMPFAAYTSLTSLIAVLSSPLFLVPLLAGGGAFIYQKGDRRLREGLIPIVVTQLAVAGSELSFDEQYQEYIREVIKCWYEAGEDYKSLRREVEKLAGSILKFENKKQAIKKQINIATLDIEKNSNESQSLMLNVGHSIQAELERIVAGEWGPGMALVAESLAEEALEVKHLSVKRIGGGTIRRFVEKAMNELSRRKKERRLREMVMESAGKAYTLWKGGEEIKNSQTCHSFELIEELGDAFQLLIHEKDDQRSQLKDCNATIKALVSEKKIIEGQLRDAEAKYYGIAEQL